MWVCRAGKNAVFLDYYIDTSRIYLAWDGFNIDLNTITQAKDFKTIVSIEKKTDNPTSVSNWASQLNSFTYEIQKNDYVLIPYMNSRSFALVQVTGPYEYDEYNEKKLFHTHKVKVIATCIPREIFPQSIQYGLRAYRTVYKVKNEVMILDRISKWKQKEKQN